MTDDATRNHARRLACALANADRSSDYDLWRALKQLDAELYALDRQGLPVPIALLRARRILVAARNRQTAGEN